MAGSSEQQPQFSDNAGTKWLSDRVCLLDGNLHCETWHVCLGVLL
jgi:hypothetical protein